MLGLSACCDKKDNNIKDYSESVTQEQVETQTVYVIVTGSDGKPATNADGYGSTKVSFVTATKPSTTKKTKKNINETSLTYKVKGGTDPYVADPFN